MEKIILDIAKAMKDQGLSETRLASLAGLNQKRVNNLLAGRTKRLDMAVVDKLRQTLGMVAASPPVPADNCGSCGGNLTRKQQILLELCNDEVLLDEAIKYAEKEKLLRELMRERADKQVA